MQPIAEAAPQGLAGLAARAAAYQPQLDLFKRSTPLQPRSWYPYDTLGELYTLRELHGAAEFSIDELLASGPVLDLCCGDGDLAFFLASEGREVDAVDWPPTNYNHMAGARAMRAALNPTVGVHEANLDGAFTLPRRFYRVVFFMGALYHLKNPLTVLERIADHCDYCILTTRVTRYDAQRQTDIGSLPVAYLVGSTETNEDETNFWIFTPTGLERILERAGWRVVSMMTRGSEKSDPASAAGDERAFCVLRSTRSCLEYLDGVYAPEAELWHWAKSEFRVRVWHVPREGVPVSLPLYVPDELLTALGSITVRASAGSIKLPPVMIDSPGCHEFPIPRDVLRPGFVEIDLRTDKALPPDATDPRERAIVLRQPDSDA